MKTLLSKFWIYLTGILVMLVLFYRGKAARVQMKRERDQKLAALKSNQVLTEANNVIAEADKKIQEDLKDVDNHKMDNTTL